MWLGFVLGGVGRLGEGFRIVEGEVRVRVNAKMRVIKKGESWLGLEGLLIVCSTKLLALYS